MFPAQQTRILAMKYSIMTSLKVWPNPGMEICKQVFYSTSFPSN
jgi:hypothetical protein